MTKLTLTQQEITPNFRIASKFSITGLKAQRYSLMSFQLFIFQGQENDET